MKSIKQQLGKIIQIYRKNHKLSQKELATKLNYSQSVISRIEKGYDVINLDVYVDALASFNLTCNPNEAIKEQVNTIIDTAFKQIIFLDEEGLKKSLATFDIIMPNILYYHDYLVFKAYDSFYDGNDDLCLKQLKQVKGFENLLENNSKILFQYLKASILLKSNRKANIKEHYLKSLEDCNGINDYILGVYYYHTYQYSKALTALLDASENFLKDNNSKRYGRTEVYIIRILMKDNDYFNIKLRLEKFLKRNPDLIIRDQATLLFQLAYSHFYLNGTERAYQLFTSIKHDYFEYSDYLDYMIYKCEERLGLPITKPIDTETVNEHNIFYYLYHHYKDDNKSDVFYKAIETFLLPQIYDNFEIKDYQIHLLDLLNYYFQTKRYKKYKQLAQKINLIYGVV